MKKQPFRLSEAFLPLSLILSTVISRSSTSITLFICFVLLNVCTLNSIGCFRNASAAEPGIRRVDGRFYGSLIQSLCGCGIFAGILHLTHNLTPETAIIGTSAAFIFFEKLFEERLYAIGRSVDAILLSCISGIIIGGGLLLDAILPTSALTVLSALIVSFCNQPFRKRTPIFNITHIGRAAIRDLLLPVILCFCSCKFALQPLYMFASYGLDRIFRCFARCSDEESRIPAFVLSLACLIACSSSYYMKDSICGAAFCLGVFVTYILSLSFSKKWLFAGVTVLAAGIACYFNQIPVSIALSLISTIIAFDRRMFLRKV